MKVFIKFIAISVFFCTSVFAVDAQMEIVKKGLNVPKISVNVATDSLNKALIEKILKIVKKDLEVSGHFDVVQNKEILNYEQKPNVIVLRNQGVDLVLNVATKSNNQNDISLLVKLYDINSGQMILNRSFLSSRSDRYPFVAHRVSIAINDYMKAPSIAWMDKFVIFSKLISAKESEIVIADYTLTYQKVIVKGGLNIFPKWANFDQREFYYTTYNKDKPTLVKTNLYTGQTVNIASSDGMIAISDINEDGSKLLLTMSPQNQPDIYMYDVVTKAMNRITTYSGIDVGGHFVDNEKGIVFVSDRLNYPNIFLQKVGSRAVERIVFHGRNNSSVATYRNYIVYSSKEGDNEFSRNAFNLYLVSTQSDFVKKLTTTGRNQFPKFSNDGETILFLKNFQEKSSLGIIRLNYDKTFLFPVEIGNIQSIDW